MDFEIELSNIEFVDDEADMEMMYDFIDQLEKLPNQRDAIPSIFKFFENNYDKEFGSPGPLVHFLESDDDYQEELKLSIHRKPTALTVWMVNRIVNGVSEVERQIWLEKLHTVCNDENADSITKDSAKEFIEHQNGWI